MASRGGGADARERVNLAWENIWQIIPVLNKIDLPARESSTPEHARGECRTIIGLDTSYAPFSLFRQTPGVAAILHGGGVIVLSATGGVPRRTGIGLSASRCSALIFDSLLRTGLPPGVTCYFGESVPVVARKDKGAADGPCNTRALTNTTRG